jgi:hypothetical protein
MTWHKSTRPLKSRCEIEVACLNLFPVLFYFLEMLPVSESMIHRRKPFSDLVSKKPLAAFFSGDSTIVTLTVPSPSKIDFSGPFAGNGKVQLSIVHFVAFASDISH